MPASALARALSVPPANRPMIMESIMPAAPRRAASPELASAPAVMPPLLDFRPPPLPQPLERIAALVRAQYNAACKSTTVGEWMWNACSTFLPLVLLMFVSQKSTKATMVDTEQYTCKKCREAIEGHGPNALTTGLAQLFYDHLVVSHRMDHEPLHGFVKNWSEHFEYVADQNSKLCFCDVSCKCA